MRVTNGMMQNQLLNQLNKNMQQLSVLSMQQASTKKIQKASDDPIVASRALKFRALLAQNAQYQKTLIQAESWLNTADEHFKGISENMETLKEKINYGANETNTLSDRKALVAEISGIRDILAAFINSTHDTRYLFSGCRTDQEAIFTSDQSGLDYTITENFSLKDVDFSHPYILSEPYLSNFNTGEEASTRDCTRLRLGYDNILANGSTYVPQITLTYADGTTANVPYTIMKSDAQGAYQPRDADPLASPPVPGEVIFLEDTGELIFGDGVLDATGSGKVADIQVEYQKITFSEGDKNPLVYFNCVDNNTNIAYSTDNQNIDYIIGLNSTITVNMLAKDVLTSALLNDLDDLINSINALEELTLDDIKLLYPAENDEDELEKLLTAHNNAVTEYATRLFDNMITKIGKHADALSIQNTILGSRMQKADMIGEKLKDENTNYEELKSDNEDADMATVLVNMETMTTVYISSLQAAANILQMSLLSYL